MSIRAFSSSAPSRGYYILLNTTPYKNHLHGFVEGLGLGVQSLSRSGLSSNSAESLDLQGSASLDNGLRPFQVLSLGGFLLGNDLSVLVLGQLLLGQSTTGLGLASTEDNNLGKSSLGDLALLHGSPPHALHSLHGSWIASSWISWLS